MLKKSDLAKQFELVVQQEIKNFNDRSSSFQDTLNFLKEYIERVEQRSLDRMSLLESQNKSLEIECQYLRDCIGLHSSSINRNLNDSKEEHRKINQKLDIAYENALEAHRKNEHNQNTITHLMGCLETLEDEISGHSISISNNFEGISHRLSKDMKRLKEEILAIPSEAEGVKKDLEEKISSHVVDVVGLLREVRLNRHDLMVAEKKIENLYTLIDRLKKSGGSA